MLGFYFIFGLVASYPLCISGLVPYECVEQEERECDQTLFPTEFPTTVDQLRDICRDVQIYGGCVYKIYESCVQDTADIAPFREILDYIHDVCEEDSEVLQVISSNFQCITSNIQNIYQSCNTVSFSEPTKELIDSLRHHANKSQQESERPDNWCLDTLWLAYCPSIKVGISCGFEAGAAVKDVLLHTSGHTDPQLCSPEFLAEVTPMLEVIEVAILEEENLKKMEETEEEPPAEQARRKRRFASPFLPFMDFS